MATGEEAEGSKWWFAGELAAGMSRSGSGLDLDIAMVDDRGDMAGDMVGDMVLVVIEVELWRH